MDFPTGNARVPDFPWGPVVKVHEVGDLDPIIEHHPQIFENSIGTHRYDKERTHFTLAVLRNNGLHSWEGFNTLDEALIGAICQKRNGGTGAARWVFKLVGL